MAGGTWAVQNKLQPGVYINFKSSPNLLTSIGERGIVAIARPLNWGTTGDFINIKSLADVYDKLGYDISSSEMMFLRQIFRGTTSTAGASEVLVWRLGTTGGETATGTVDKLTIKANSPGSRGNDISIVITPDPNSEVEDGIYAVYTVNTIVDGAIVDTQTIGSYIDNSTYTRATISDLKNNVWVSFSGTETENITPTAGITLEGGENGTVSATAYSDFLTALEPKSFNVVIYDGSDAVTKAAFAMFAQHVSYDSGRYCQAVMENYISADNETAISVKNGFSLNDGTILTEKEATWWVGGATAGANNNQSLTYAIHPDAVDVVPRYSSEELDNAIREGSFVFIEEFGKVKVLTDINTFTSFTKDKGKSFRKNRVIRVLFSIANDIYKTFATYYIGKVDNTDTGRNLLKAEIIGYINQLQGNNAVQNFSADDVEVLQGEDVDSVIVNVAIQPVDAVEKVYMTVTVS